MPKKAAAVAIFDDLGRILLIHEGYGLRRWGLLGGAQEPNEDPRQTAVRDVSQSSVRTVG